MENSFYASLQAMTTRLNDMQANIESKFPGNHSYWGNEKLQNAKMHLELVIRNYLNMSDYIHKFHLQLDTIDEEAARIIMQKYSQTDLTIVKGEK